MPTDISVTINPPNSTSVTIGGALYPHANTHLPNGSDPITGFATYQQLIDVSGLITTAGNAVDLTSDQNISGVKNFISRPTVNGVPVLISGEGGAAETGYLTGYVAKTETGVYSLDFYPRTNPSGYITGVNLSDYATIPYVTGLSGYLQNQIVDNNYYVVSGDFNENNGEVTLFRTGDGGSVIFSIDGRYVTGQVVRPSETGSFLITGAADSRYYPLSSNPSSYLVAADIVSLASTGYVTGVSGYLQAQISAINSQSGNFITTGQTGQFYAASNPANYITGVDLSNYATTGYVTGVSGYLASLISASSAGVRTLNGLSGSLTLAGAGNNTVSVAGSTITVSGATGFLTGYQPVGNYVTTSQTGGFLTTGAGDSRYYPLSSNPLSYLVAADISSLASTGYVTGVSGYLQGQINNINSATGVFITSSQTGQFYPINNPSGYITGVDLSQYATIAFVTGVSGYHSGLISNLQSATGILNTRLSSVEGVTGLFALASNTGAFLTTGAGDNRYTLQSATGAYTGAFYPLTGNPSGFLVSADLSTYATQSYVTGVSGHLQGQITSIQNGTGGFITGVDLSNYATIPFVTGISGYLDIQISAIESVTGQFSLSANTGSFLTTGAGDVRYALQSNTGSYSNLFYPLNSNPSGYITGVNLSNYATVPYVTGVSGHLQTQVSAINSQTGNFVTTGQTGQFYAASNPANYITGVDLSSYATTGYVTGVSGYLASLISASSAGVGTLNGLSGTITVAGAGNNSVTVAGSTITVSGSTGFLTGYQPIGSYVTASQTGGFLTTGAGDARYYPLSSNPSSYLVAADVSNLASTGYVTGVSGHLQGQINGINSTTGVFITSSQTGQFYPINNPSGFITGVDLSSYATITFATGISGYHSGLIANLQSATGTFVTTEQTGSFLTSGTLLEGIQLYGKNDESFALYKGQPVYIGGANGENPLIKRASNTGERTSSRTIGLLAQNLNSNDFGYIVSEGILEGFNTSAATAGDPMWLGTTGDIIFGTGNKPYGNNHLVYLGVVLRSQSNNGKVYVKPQNGFEIEELHRVYAKNASSNDTLMYNSSSGSWFARQINTGDVSGISAYALASNTGSFITSSQTGAFAASALTGAFLTTGAADGRYYGLSNGQSISGYAITGFNDAITGMTITGDTTKFITLFQRDGSTVTGSFADNAGTGGGGGGGSINVNDSNLVISISMFA
jgi:hypothetical protein